MTQDTTQEHQRLLAEVQELRAENARLHNVAFEELLEMARRDGRVADQLEAFIAKRSRINGGNVWMTSENVNKASS
jgi:hypothetical protein